MKKLLFALLPALLLLSACGDDKEYKLDVDTRAMTFSAEDAGAQTLTVTAENVDWGVEPDAAAAWLHLEKREGSVSVTVDDNTEAEPRQARFTITSNVTQVSSIGITLTQSAKSDGSLLDASPKELTFAASDAPAATTT